MAKVQNLAAVLQAFARRLLPKTRVVIGVGYTAGYAIFVHENLAIFHPNGQAKFLETPARQLQPQLATMVREAVHSGLSLRDSLLRAGLFLQAASQQLVPVRTGNLRASAFTREES